MKIIICEDEQYWAEVLKKAVKKWASVKSVDIQCTCFTTPQRLMLYLKENDHVDVIFLDITLGEASIDGMALAKLIRKTGGSMPIIFVSADPYRAADGYLVEAMGYLVKPIDENRLTLFLDRIIKQKRSQRVIIIESESRVTPINLRDIIFVEIRNHIVQYHTTQGIVNQRTTLNKVLLSLGEEYFVQIHRSYIIALDRIESIKSTYPYSVTLTVDNEPEELPVSRKYIKNLLDVYSDDLLEKMI